MSEHCRHFTNMRVRAANHDEPNGSCRDGRGSRLLSRRCCLAGRDLDFTTHGNRSRPFGMEAAQERETLYKDFITEASRLTIDSLAHSLDQPDQLVALYGILSCMRLMSGEEVVRQGEACCRRIVEMYGRPNLTAEQFRTAIEDHDVDEIDTLKEFSTACRKELLQGQN